MPQKAGGATDEDECGVGAFAMVGISAVPVSNERFKESLMVESSVSEDMMKARVEKNGVDVSELSGEDGKMSGSLFTGERRRRRKEVDKDGEAVEESW